MNDFYTDTLQYLLRKKLITEHMRILVVCGGEHDKQALEQTGFRDVTISNLDRRMKRWRIRGILVVRNGAISLPKQPLMFVTAPACYQAHGS